ncbi:MAG: hypothetical protein Q8911_00030 [Bacillota bacterium]|nr:hypothetical protein [Bacillota bacterium]
MATIKKNYSVDEKTYNEFVEIAETKGIKVSPWITQQMKRFIEEEKERESKKKK